jgi:hypothetical protein
MRKQLMTATAAAVALTGASAHADICSDNAGWVARLVTISQPQYQGITKSPRAREWWSIVDAHFHESDVVATSLPVEDDPAITCNMTVSASINEMLGMGDAELAAGFVTQAQHDLAVRALLKIVTYVMLNTPELLPLAKNSDPNAIKKVVMSYRASFTLKPTSNGGYLATVTDRQLSFALPEEGKAQTQQRQ